MLLVLVISVVLVAVEILLVILALVLMLLVESVLLVVVMVILAMLEGVVTTETMSPLYIPEVVSDSSVDVSSAVTEATTKPAGAEAADSKPSNRST